MTQPKAGQRWNSTSEPELGLGLVIEADASRVQLLFPAVGEMRSYAWAQAPLARFALKVGDELQDQEGNSWIVEEVREQEGLLSYVGSGKLLPESGLADRMLSLQPLERLRRGEHDPAEDFAFRRMLLEKRRDMAAHPAAGFFGARVEILPHQVNLVEEVSQRLHPRVLLADEVGLGKTIEACLLLHQGIRRGCMQRILILVPDALVHQWYVELLRRFHLSFSIFDAERMAQSEENAFFNEQWILCSLDLIAASPQAASDAIDADWDLVVVDEAHHLTWSPEEVSPAYALVEGLATRSEALFLLSATPAQLGLESYFAQLKLLDPDRYRSFAAFQQEQQDYVAVAEEAERLKQAGEQQAFEQLLLRHGPGRILFRNTREQIKGFPKRIPHPYPVQGDKGSWLQDFLQEHSEEKILILTSSPQEVRELAKLLEAQLEPPPVLFHEEQDILVRDRQAAWFADPEGSRVMIASDIGGEGRNFQFVQHLVLMDLPRNPERIEQRIGRLDRIGQQSRIHLHLPYLAGSDEESWFRWLHEGLGAFAQPLACAQACFLRFASRLDQVDEALLAETRAVLKHLEEEYRAGPQRLITWKHEIARPESRVFQALQEAEEDHSLLPFANRLWQAHGLDIEQLSDQEYRLKTGYFFSGELSIREEGFRFTANRRQALAREDLDFLSWDHPLLQDAWEASLRSSKGSMALAESSEIRQPQLEAIYVLEVLGHTQLQLSRYLPPSPLQLCVDVQGLAVEAPRHLVSLERIPALLSHPKFLDTWLPARLKNLEEQAEQAIKPMLDAALEEARSRLDQELQRLEDLKAINDHVREEEIVQLRNHQSAVLEALGHHRLRLDALRVILPMGVGG